MDFFNFLKNNRLIIISISIISNILLVVFGTYYFIRFKNIDCPTCNIDGLLAKSEEKEVSEKDATFYVEVKGAVKKPGVYLMKRNDIINDVINLAGGFTKSAYTKNINLSRKVVSELVIYVYTSSEYKKAFTKTSSNTVTEKVIVKETVCECPTYDIEPCIEKGTSEIVIDKNELISNSDNQDVTIVKSNDPVETTTNNTSNNSNSNESSLININTATKEELITLSGIGDSKANDIISYRNEHGLFKSIEEIKNISGIGNAIFEKIKDYITI